MGRLIALLYGLACYALFLVTFLYAIGFVAGLPVAKAIDSGEPGALLPSLVVDALLLGLFAVQHSVMARPGFKAAWTKLVPKSVERSTYVLLSSLALLLLFWQWRPLPDPVWVVEGAGATALQALAALGWLTVLSSTFMIDHFDLFGLRQVWLNWTGCEYSFPGFAQRFLYKLVRHPIMLGFLVAFWSTPTMTVGHLLFSLATTGYILVALQLEERDLVRHIGEPYLRYQQEVPMLLPFTKRK